MLVTLQEMFQVTFISIKERNQMNQVFVLKYPLHDLAEPNRT